MIDNRTTELGSRNCRITETVTDGLCSDNPRKWFKLSCGHSFTIDGLETPVACPLCGKFVEPQYGDAVALLREHANL